MKAIKKINFNKTYWKKVYYGISHWIFRRLSNDDLKIYNDKIEDWQYIIDKFTDFERELYISYFDKKGARSVPFEEYQVLCNKYIHQAKKDGYHRAIEFFFTLYKEYPTEYIHFTDFLKSATKEEVEQARLDFEHVKEMHHDEVHEHDHTFSDDAKVLEYRGIRLIIDNEWGDAWIKDENGKVHHFQLIWDWDYPIDQYIAYHIL